MMIRTLPAIVDKNGNVHLTESVKLDSEHRALVVIMDDAEAELPHLACEQSLMEWNLPEEDQAWMHLQDSSS